MEREGQQGSEFVVKGRKRPAQNRMTSSTEEDTDDEIEVVNKKHDKVPLDNNDNEDEELEQPVFDLKGENSEESEELVIGNNDQLRVIATKIAKQAEVIRQKTGGVEGEIEEADEQEKTGGVEGDIEEADEQEKTGGVEGEIEVADEQERTGGVEGEIEVADEQERTGGVEYEMKEADEQEEERKAAWNKGKELYCNVDNIDYEVIGNNDQLRVIATKIAKQAEVIRQKTGGVEGEIEEADGVEGDIEEAGEQEKTGGVEGEIEVADEQERTGGVEDEMKEADEQEEERKAAWNKGKELYCNVDNIDYELPSACDILRG